MALIAVTDYARLLSNKLQIEFFNGTLTQLKRLNPKTFSGPGNISQDENGRLRLTLYHSYSDENQMVEECLGDFNKGLPFGKIIADEHYFSFEATDMQGIQWRAEKLWLEGDVSFPAGGRIVKANIRSLQAVEPRTQFGHQLNATGYAVIPGRYRFPSRRVEWNESREKYGKCELNLQGKLCTVLCYEDRLEIRFEIPASAPVEEYAQRLLQAIGFSIGAFLSPILEGTNDQSDRYQIVNARRKDIEVARILPPIPTSFPQHEANIEGLVNSFLSRAPEPYPKFLGYWYRILISTDGDVENQALVLSTAIEGVAKTYFCEQLKADDMYVAEVDAAIPLLNALDIGSRAKDFVIQSLHGSKGSNVKNALHKLAALGLITDDLIKIWKRLRNKSAHADGLQMGDADLQRLIDDIHSCLELFYRLVLAHIAYAGPFLRYSESGGEAGTPPTGQLPLA